MARQRKEPSADNIKLRQPDRSGPDPSKATLVDFATDRDLFAAADRRQRELDEQNAGKSGKAKKKKAKRAKADDGELSPGAVRFLDTLLWTSTLTMLHFTFDVLVQSQYGTEIDWPKVWSRVPLAWFLFIILFYPLHPHEPNAILVPGVPEKYQHYIRQFIFSVMSVVCGCYLIYITNAYSYLHVLKRAPPLACLWVWAVIELDLLWGTLSLLGCLGFALKHGYGFS